MPRRPKRVVGKMRLEEAGAKALQAWCKARDVSLQVLGEGMGGSHHPVMLARRAMTREGLLTLEQIGRTVSFCAGEVTAAQLVGLDLAAAIPVFPLRALPVMVPLPPSVPLPVGLPMHPGDPPPAGAEPAVPLSGRAMLEHLLAHSGSDRVRLEAARSLVRLDADETEAKGAPAEREADLIDKFNTLLVSARRQWKLAQEPPATPPPPPPDPKEEPK